MAILKVLCGHLTKLVAETRRESYDWTRLRSCTRFRKLPIGPMVQQSPLDL